MKINQFHITNWQLIPVYYHCTYWVSTHNLWHKSSSGQLLQRWYFLNSQFPRKIGQKTGGRTHDMISVVQGPIKAAEKALSWFLLRCNDTTLKPSQTISTWSTLLPRRRVDYRHREFRNSQCSIHQHTYIVLVIENKHVYSMHVLSKYTWGFIRDILPLTNTI